MDLFDKLHLIIIQSILFYLFICNNVFADDAFILNAFKKAANGDLEASLIDAEKSADPKFAVASVNAINFYKNSSNSSLKDISNFLQNNSWIPENLFESRIESTLSSKTPYQDILIWFGQREPISNKAKLFYIHANLQRKIDNTKRQELISLLRFLWRTNEFDLDSENFFLDKYKKYLTLNDCLEKIDFLSWKRSFKLAKKFIDLLPKHYRLKPEKRLELIKALDEEKVVNIKNASNSDDIIEYFYIQKLFKLGYTDVAINRVLSLKYSRNQEVWWKIRNFAIRECINETKFPLAYKIALHHNLKSGKSFAEAEWMAGWIALRFMHKPDVALKHFENMYKAVKLGVSKAKAAYWLYASYKAKHSNEEANRWLQEASKYSSTFYGQIAIAISGKKVDYFANNEQYAIKDNDVLPIARFAYYLNKIGYKELARKTIDSIASLNLDQMMLEEIGSFFAKQGASSLSVELGRTASNKFFIAIKNAYPNHIKINNGSLNDALYYSIIRQESGFDEMATSSAGAFGLMQLMPQTAMDISKILSLPKDAFAKDPKSNVAIGVAYFDSLYEKNDKDLILAIASYNAGYGNVKKWINRFGDVSKFKSLEEKIDWIESIPFHQTRDYVKKVLENAVLYDYLLTSENINASILDFLMYNVQRFSK